MAQITSNAITFVDNTGVKKYLYIKYSNDGVSFTENDGLTPGEWLGICNSNSSPAPTDFNAYTWSKVKGADGGTFYTWIKYADDANGTNMSDSPNGKTYLGISYNNDTETESDNPKDYTWSLMVSRGIDRIEEYYVALSIDTGVTTDPSFGWDTVMPTLTTTNKYLWNYEETFFTDGDSDVTDPVIIGVHGEDGIGITDIDNYYATTSTPDTVPESWIPEEDGVPPLTNEDKYLWNYERIYYTNGKYKDTKPAIIGVYGDEGIGGEAFVDFQIYSVDGFEFSEDVATITLNTVASKAGDIIKSGAKYQWYWHDGGNYIAISGATSDSLEVNYNDEYAFSSIKCVMKYDNIPYEDYVSLTKKSTVYSSTIKFFNGSNTFGPYDKYLVAYVELYKDGATEETVLINQHYYSNKNSVGDDGVITTDIPGDHQDGTLMYFVYADGPDYGIVLGECKSASWFVFEQTESRYTYTNTFKENITSNVFTISRNSVSKSAEIGVTSYIKNTDVELSKTSATVFDTNDPIISSDPPETKDVKDGQLWLNTSVEPYTLYIFVAHKGYTLGEAKKVTIYQSSKTSDTKSVTYGDKIQINDNGTVSILNKQNSSFSYSNNENAKLVLGNFCTAHATQSIYYAQPGASITKNSSTATGIASYTVSVSKAQEVIVDPGKIGTGEWIYFDQQNGGTVYTSKPENGYKAGDLWILADGESCGDYTVAGTMLKATVTSSTFDESHWTDSMDYVTSTIKSIKETFHWEDDGLKICRQVEEDGIIKNPFYVHIDSTRMGFHSVSDDGKDVEVVHIGNNSAEILNATFNGNEDIKTTFNNDAIFNNNIMINGQLDISNTGSTNGFSFKIESDGSLSLVLM